MVAPSEVEIRMNVGAGLSGTVRDRQGTPIPSFVVLVAHPRGELQLEVVAVDPEGRYEIPALPAGEYRVTVTAARYAPSESVRVVLGREDLRADFVLGRGGTIAGWGRGAVDSQPLPRAKVSLEAYFAGSSSAMPLRNSSITDAEGRFELTGVGPGLQAIFVAAANHHARVRGGRRVAPGKTVEVDVELTPTEEGETSRI